MPFGTYVQAYEDNQIKNDNKPRTIDAIYLRALPKSGHELMNLETGEQITRARIWEVPITAMVIKAVEEMAYKQSIKSLKITSRNKVPLLPANWVAGVDHDKELKDGEDDDYMPTLEELQTDETDETETENIDQEELDDLLCQEKEPDPNPNVRNDNNNEEQDDDDGEPIAQEAQVMEQPQPEQQPAQVIAETVTDDDETVEHEGRERRQPERLTYPSCFVFVSLLALDNTSVILH